VWGRKGSGGGQVDSRKIAAAFMFTLAIVVFVSLLWKQPLLLSVVLISLSILKHYFSPIKNEFLWFILIAVWGTTAEILIMYFGSRPWVYAQPLVLDVALWTPLLWGSAATIFITLHEGIFKKK
jgi:hypothetical protein